MNLGSWLDISALVGEFHFLRPLFLFGIPLALGLGILLLVKRESTRWEDLIPAQILSALRVTGGRSGNIWKWLAPLFLILGSLALAGPTWTKIPVPTSKAQSALVILVDMSPSMLATDVTPNRLTRVKFKLIDILRSRTDGQTALIAYAGTPHRVAPLTDDTRTIEALLPALSPAVMPVSGSDTESAVELAINMMQSAGVVAGDLLLITDGVAPGAQRTINDMLGPEYRLLILGVGSTDAVPIPRPTGGFISDSRGEIVLTELNRDELQILAGRHRGRYVEMQTDDSDIRYLLQDDNAAMQAGETLDTVYDSWQDVGYFLLILLLPIAAYSFRRGVVFLFPLVILFPQDSQALSWQDLWKTPDQQGAEALENADTALAAEAFEDPNWKAHALYRDGQYEAAAAELESQETKLAHYNQGNSLALKGDFEEAISSYEAALESDPDFEDARYNKELIEQLLEQQNQQQDQQQDQNESEESQDSDQSESSEPSEEGQGDPSDGDPQDEPSDSEAGEQPPEESEDEQPEQEQPSDSEQSDEQQEPEEQQSEAGQPEDETEEPAEETEAEMASAEETPEQLDPASEQWLRGIADDPSGLLRRKFRYESENYEREQRYLNAPPNSTREERY